ncbi:hypothetical protein PRZ48_010389 [Zasmidium cellare]|uniref:Major facilitator superfamily (MFS) profile domain-containing protein n=1 Tax=Zasmidium cellare TaxID=395010 RepID=A0ABR0E927_ZASCE|nr:hypothetical protein PRZ48_010389 [Zasmidium cellare]
MATTATVVDEAQPLLGNETLRYDGANGKNNQADIVDFDPEGDEENPMDWPTTYKWGIVALLAFMAFTVTFTCISLVPVANEIIKDIGGHKNKSASVLLVTIWELGEAAGPLFIAPLSEVFGRYPVLNVANIAFVGVILMASFSPSVGVLIAARFLTGLSVSSNVLNPAIVGDMFISEQRGTAMSCIMLCPLLGGAFGPAIAGAIADSLGWRPVLWICATLAGICELCLLTLFRETFKVPILRRRAARLRKETGNENLICSFDVTDADSKAQIWESIARPVVIFASSGVLQAMSIFGSVSFTFFYVVSTTLPDICDDIYNLNPTQTGFVFISYSVGSIVSVVICNRLLDRIYIHLRDTHKGVGIPEYRLPLVIVGAFTLPICAAFYGWVPGLQLPLVVCLSAVALMGVTGMLGFLPVMSYVVDAFGLYSASAMTAIIVVRCLMGTFLPLVTQPLVERLGWGWAFTTLGAFTILLAPIPALVMRYGAKWRQRSSYTKEE